MMIATNRFFLDCIYNILLDLGVNDVNQCNFEEFVEQVIEAGVKIESSKDKLANMVNNNGKYKKRWSDFIDKIRVQIHTRLTESVIRRGIQFQLLINKQKDKWQHQLLIELMNWYKIKGLM